LAEAARVVRAERAGSMNLDFSPEEIAFRDEVRGFIRDNYPNELRDKSIMREDLTKAEFLAWHKILGKKGWSAPAWPVEYGGTGWTATQRYIWLEENARAETIPPLPFGVSMVGPVIYTFGTPEQKARFLPGILSGETWWCQGYSEPGAGSDLASVKTKAVRQKVENEGDFYIVNGQKTWTTLGQHADWGFFLVRTDSNAKAQEGISFLLIDMRSPGVSVRPIKLLDGGHEVNDVFLEDVRVPVDQRVYEENKGWTCAKFLLAHERSGIAGVARSKRSVERLKQIAKAEIGDDGRSLIEDEEFQRKLAELEINLSALEMTELRVLAREHAGKGPGPESSLLKIKGTEIQQRLTELTLEAVGNYAQPYFRDFPADGDNAFPIGPDYAHNSAPVYFNWRKASIYGGSNEIQRNIIAKMVLGL
jgi:alkylation response protein AidB-like acyl-CoA dehydrogenase